jgi:hypothetical protein
MGKLFAVLGASVMAALLITLFFVVEYSPKAGYVVNAVLIEPDILTEFNYNDVDPKTGAMDRFVFDSIVVKNGAVEIPFPMAQYQALYKKIALEQSVEPMESVFSAPSTLKLVIYSRTESPAAWQAAKKEFQLVEFSPAEGFFRVELHEGDPGIHWVYFRQKGVYESVLQELKP